MGSVVVLFFPVGVGIGFILCILMLAQIVITSFVTMFNEAVGNG